MTADGPPYKLRLNHGQRKWMQDEEIALADEIEAWAMDNLRHGWSVHTSTRREHLLKGFDSEVTVRMNWIEFEDYRDWLLFKLRWCDQ